MNAPGPPFFRPHGTLYADIYRPGTAICCAFGTQKVFW